MKPEHERILAIITFLFFLICIIASFISTENAYIVGDEYKQQLTAGIVNDVVGELPELEVAVEEEIVEEVGVSELLIGYASTAVNVRSKPSMNDDNIIGVIYINTEIEYELINGKDYDWCKFDYDGESVYVRADLIKDEPVEIITNEQTKEQNYNDTEREQQGDQVNSTANYSGDVLTKSVGVVYGPSGRETYYNLPMNNCIRYMKDLGYDYEYWVRNDGVKMYGNYIMVAGNTNVYPKGTIIQTSLGLGIICDHCEAAEWGISNLDIAVTW